MAAEHREEFDGQSTDAPASVVLLEEEDVDHRHEAIRTMMDAFMEGGGCVPGTHTVLALDRDAVWDPCPGVVWEVALRKSAPAPVV